MHVLWDQTLNSRKRKTHLLGLILFSALMTRLGNGRTFGSSAQHSNIRDVKSSSKCKSGEMVGLKTPWLGCFTLSMISEKKNQLFLYFRQDRLPFLVYDWPISTCIENGYSLLIGELPTRFYMTGITIWLSLATWVKDQRHFSLIFLLVIDLHRKGLKMHL